MKTSLTIITLLLPLWIWAQPYTGSQGSGYASTAFSLPSEEPDTPRVQLWPTTLPAGATLHIQLQNISAPLEWRIWDPAARLIAQAPSQTLTSGTTLHITAPLVQGAYLLELRIGDTILTKKFVVQGP